MKTAASYRFFKHCKKEGYLKQKKVLLALSGGQDSMTLLNWLIKYQEQLEFELVCAHVNYGLRESSDREEKLLREKLSQLKIKFEVAYYKNSQKKFSEEAGRKFRYDFFEQMMIDNNCQVLLTAHHKNDVAETIFMREITGRRLRYLTGISEVQNFATGKLIRPLLGFDKSELDAEMFFEDYTNAQTDYLRNRVRNNYLPELEVENPRFQESLMSRAEEIDFAMKIIRDQIDQLAILQERVSLELYKAQSKELQYYILQEYLAGFPELQLSRGHFQDLLQILSKAGQHQSEIGQGYSFVKTVKQFYIEQISSRKFEILYACEADEKSQFFEVDLPEKGEIIVRQRQVGDRILQGKLNKKLKQYLINEKISLENRRNPVIEVDGKIYAMAFVVRSDLSKRLKNDKMRRTIWVKMNSSPGLK